MLLKVEIKFKRETCARNSYVVISIALVSNKILKKDTGSSYAITELIPVPCSQPAGDVSHKPAGRLPLLFARPAVTPTTLKRASTNFAAW